jgi:hypothetical protein
MFHRCQRLTKPAAARSISVSLGILPEGELVRSESSFLYAFASLGLVDVFSAAARRLSSARRAHATVAQTLCLSVVDAINPPARANPRGGIVDRSRIHPAHVDATAQYAVMEAG